VPGTCLLTVRELRVTPAKRVADLAIMAAILSSVCGYDLGVEVCCARCSWLAI
jgi:hypothetical protein